MIEWLPCRRSPAPVRPYATAQHLPPIFDCASIFHVLAPAGLVRNESETKARLG